MEKEEADGDLGGVESGRTRTETQAVITEEQGERKGRRWRHNTLVCVCVCV